jgi:hypothetical protein
MSAAGAAVGNAVAARGVAEEPESFAIQPAASASIRTATRLTATVRIEFRFSLMDVLSSIFRGDIY